MQQKKIKQNSFVLRRRRNMEKCIEELIKSRNILPEEIWQFLPLEISHGQDDEQQGS